MGSAAARLVRIRGVRFWSQRLLIVLATGLLGCSLVCAQSLSGRVDRVYDGDTIKVESLGKVRLLGIDTPEWKATPRDQYYLRQGVSRKRLRVVAEAARRRVIALSRGQRVTLELDGDGKDRYGRLLAYVRLPDGRLLNRLLLAEGLASAYRKFSFRLKKEFLAVEREAREQGRGLWRRQP